ncbi:MAG: alpha/beta hydrolase-fold protein [Acidobacteriota bacterium]
MPPGGGKGKAKGPELTREEAQRERDLSEKDTMNVLELVSKEYAVDPDRTFLMGHSMGGMGAYFLGQKYASKWAAVAPMSGTMAGADYHLDRLKKVPMLISVGETETATANNAQAQVEEMKKLGMSARYLEIPQGTHMSMIPPTVPQILAFFAPLKRKQFCAPSQRTPCRRKIPVRSGCWRFKTIVRGRDKRAQTTRASPVPLFPRRRLL